MADENMREPTTSMDPGPRIAGLHVHAMVSYESQSIDPDARIQGQNDRLRGWRAAGWILDQTLRSCNTNR